MRPLPCLAAILLAGCSNAPEPGAPVPAVPASAATTSSPRLQASPLAPRAAVSGPRFETVDARAAGIDFEHRWAPDARRANDFSGAFSAGGVALGDYDADGRPDLLLTRPAGGARLYRNLGEWRFEDTTAAAGLRGEGWTTGATFVDLDGDADLDLFVGHYDEPVEVYVNDGRGRFEERAAALGLAQKLALVQPAFADCDRDGDLDVYLVTNRAAPDQPLQGQFRVEGGQVIVPEAHRDYVAALVRPDGQVLTTNAGQRDRLLRNDAGRFVDISETSGLSGHHLGLGARFLDVNDDGQPDLYVANDFFGPDRLYLGQGGCRMQDAAPALLPVTPWFSMGVDAGDVDGDGRLDLVGTDMAGRDHRQRVTSMADEVDDGWFMDTVLPPQRMRNVLLLATTTPRFLEAAQVAGVAGTGWSWSPHLVDLDQDGLLDLHVTNGMTRDFSDSDVRARLKAAGQWDRMAMDVWKAEPPRAEPDAVFRNLGDLRFAPAGAEWGLDAAAVSYGAAFGDLDGDGDPDLVVNEFGSPPRLLRNRTADGHRMAIRLRGAGGNTAAIGARVEIVAGGVRQVRDVARSGGFMSSHDTELLFGLGAATQVESVTIRWPSGLREALGSFPADQRLDVREVPGAAPAPAPPSEPPLFLPTRALPRVLHTPSKFDELAASPLLPMRQNALGPALAAADLDGDGRDELFLGGGPGQAAVLLRVEGDRFVPRGEPAFEADAAADDLGAAFFDADGDAALDLVVTSAPVDPALAAQGGARLYLNRGGAFTRAETAFPAGGYGPVAAAMEPGGGALVFLGGRARPGRYPEAGPSRLLAVRQGKVRDLTPTVRGLGDVGLAGGATFADLDGDGRPDLVVAEEWGRVRAWRNGPQWSEITKESGLGARSGVHLALAVADLDADGDVDLVAGNLGLNTPVRATEGHPARLLFGDIRDDGAFAVLQTTVDPLAGEVPLRRFDRLAAVFPELATRYPTWGAFAAARPEEVLRPERRGRARVVTAGGLESGWWRNDRGRFEFQPFPGAAQLAPIRAVALADFDRDGRMDAFLGQGHPGLPAELGPGTSGASLLLHGEGGGRFAAWGSGRSGLLVVGAVAAALPVRALGGPGPDLAVAVSEAGPLLYRNGAP